MRRPARHRWCSRARCCSASCGYQKKARVLRDGALPAVGRHHGRGLRAQPGADTTCRWCSRLKASSRISRLARCTYRRCARVLCADHPTTSARRLRARPGSSTGHHPRLPPSLGAGAGGFCRRQHVKRRTRRSAPRAWTSCSGTGAATTPARTMLHPGHVALIQAIEALEDGRAPPAAVAPPAIRDYVNRGVGRCPSWLRESTASSSLGVDYDRSRRALPRPAPARARSPMSARGRRVPRPAARGHPRARRRGAIGRPEAGALRERATSVRGSAYGIGLPCAADAAWLDRRSIGHPRQLGRTDRAEGLH